MKRPNLKAMGVPGPKGAKAAKPARPGDVNLSRLAAAQGYKLRGKGGPAKAPGGK